MMKILLRLAFLLVCCHALTSNFSNLTKRATANEMQFFISAINEFRQKVAYAYHIANMYEFSYSLELQKEAEMMHTCADVKVGANYIPFFPPDANTWKVIESYGMSQMTGRMDKLTLQRFGFAMRVVEGLMHPLESKIGCAEFREPCVATLDPVTQQYTQIVSINYEAICLLGPLSNNTIPVIIRGHAGSACPSKNSRNGLSLLASSAPIMAKRDTSGTDRKVILDEINKGRRNFAKHVKIANMNELVYDVGLEKIAEEMTCQAQANGPDYMVAFFPDERGLKTFLEVSHDRQVEVAKQIMGGMFIPDQTKFGCIALKEPCEGPGGSIPVRCVVGPKTVFQTSDFKQGVAGSQCPSDREADDGLCRLKNGWFIS
ncbi:hypothetical protein GCK72_012171 [Caenorhabditis remanei]|uniref:Uncharacterized protein n=1 Tax=Caenorhabditis remanei TaxID=31234 RepID=A0A6A5GM51_CAERE|nr:hypothetical protein GCK72_012171 [Caenorhabditis remanei]KAF1755721.1 hypothetical protein GCK72_012171 [Caenorhabditis remanei]